MAFEEKFQEIIDLANGKKLKLYFQLMSGNIDFPEYRIYTEDKMLDFDVKLSNTPGIYEIDKVRHQNQTLITGATLTSEVNRIIKEKRKDGSYPPSFD